MRKRGDPYGKVLPGQPIQFYAAQHNAAVDAARAEQMARHDQGFETGRAERDPDIVLIYNNGSSAMSRYAVAILGAPFVLPADNLPEFLRVPNFIGNIPSTLPTLGSKYAILLEPIAESAIGRGVLSGVVPTRIFVSDEAHRFAEPTSSDHLVSASSGQVEILWKEPGTDYRWALVRLGFTGAATSPPPPPPPPPPPADQEAGHLIAGDVSVTDQFMGGGIKTFESEVVIRGVGALGSAHYSHTEVVTAGFTVKGGMDFWVMGNLTGGPGGVDANQLLSWNVTYDPSAGMPTSWYMELVGGTLKAAYVRADGAFMAGGTPGFTGTLGAGQTGHFTGGILTSVT